MVKKSISPIVATALLLVVAVVAVVGFQGWFQTYYISLFNNIESKTSGSNILLINGIYGNLLYVKSDSNQILDILEIKDENGNLKCLIDKNNIKNFSNSTELLLNFDSNSIYNNLITDFSRFNYSGVLRDINSTNYDGNTSPIIISECISNQCLLFDAIDDSIYMNKGPFKQNFNSSFTGSTWVNSKSKQNYQYIWERKYSSFTFAINSERFSFSFANGSLNTIAGSTFIYNTSKWYFVVSSYDRNSQKIKTYIDGILIGSVDATTFDSFRSDVGDYPSFGVGGRPHDGSGSFNGSIDEMAFYNKLLTDEEIKALYEFKKALFYEQIIPIGVKEIDLSSCNLLLGNIYEVFILTDKNKIEQKVIAK